MNECVLGSDDAASLKSCLESLVEQFYQPLYRFALSLSHNANDACDLTQQTFYIAQVKLHQLNDRSKLKSWLFTTLMREHLQKRRHETRFPKVDIGEVEAELPGVIDEIADSLDSKTVVEAIRSLDEKTRLPLILFYLDRKSYREIGHTLNIPIGTVMSRLARGKEQLREVMGRTEESAWRMSPVSETRKLGTAKPRGKRIRLLPQIQTEEFGQLVA